MLQIQDLGEETFFCLSYGLGLVFMERFLDLKFHCLIGASIDSCPEISKKRVKKVLPSSQ